METHWRETFLIYIRSRGMDLLEIDRRSCRVADRPGDMSRARDWDAQRMGSSL